jgi:hypothetical protein
MPDEISEPYVGSDYRSHNTGKKLIDVAMEKMKQLGWNRLEVGSILEDVWKSTIAL